MGKVKKPTSVRKPQPVVVAQGPSRRWLWLLLAVVLAVGAWIYWGQHTSLRQVSDLLSITKPSHKAVGGKIVSQEVVRNYSVQEVTALSHKADGAGAPVALYPISERLVKYTSIDMTGQEIEIYARMYLPRVPPATKVPVLAFAPGTTGIGDACAASLEQPAIANWANYQSHMASYAGQGYAVIITDYEGMRDATRIHHYMIGELEGRAVLDSAKALYSLSDYKNLDRSQLFLGGYSQGGQAVAWANRIAPTYAPGLTIKGVIAFAPVSNVTTTLTDIARGADIVWFGPFVLLSYADYYGQSFPLSQILQPKWIPTLRSDVLGHCINSVKYWTKADTVYTPQFLQAMRDNNIAAISPDLAADMAQNQAWDTPTATPKLINQGEKDTIILPDQQTKALPLLCQPGHGPVQIQSYPTASHYTVMALSLRDTLAWMAKASAGQALPSSCPGSLPVTAGGV